jgi:preprotein translocase subunit SecD
VLLTYLLFLVLGETIGFTLTLAGIAGAIVAIGVTADSFIVYFERVRDEAREGRSLRTAVETGWARARHTIIVADMISLLAAVLLYFFAVGNVRGFAFTLGLTTIVDLISRIHVHQATSHRNRTLEILCIGSSALRVLR